MLQTLQTRLTAKKRLTEDVYILELTPEDGSFDFKAGQYVILHIPQSNGETVRRLYSIASSAHTPGSFELLVKFLPGGVASEFLKKLPLGESFMCQGPAGIFILKPPTRDIVFLATGTGYAPIRSMLDHLFYHEPHFKHNIYLYWGFQKHDHVYLLSELVEWTKKFPRFHFNICLSRHHPDDPVSPELIPHIQMGRATQVWEKLHENANIQGAGYYLCGGREIVDGMKEFMASKGLSKEQVHAEKF